MYATHYVLPANLMYKSHPDSFSIRTPDTMWCQYAVQASCVCRITCIMVIVINSTIYQMQHQRLAKDNTHQLIYV